jgi:hypothetical protein
MYIKRPWIYAYVHKKAKDLYICAYKGHGFIHMYVHKQAMDLYIHYKVLDGIKSNYFSHHCQINIPTKVESIIKT